MRKSYYLKFLTTLMLLIFYGCSSAPSPVRIYVDSYIDPARAKEKTYYLEKPEKKTELELEVSSYAEMIDKMLQEEGFVKKSKKEQANYIMKFDYLVEGPLDKSVIVQQPVTGMTMGMGFGSGWGPGWGPGWGGYYGGGTIGWVDTVETIQYYVKKLRIKADTRSGDPYWEVMAVHASGNSGMRNTFPYLVEGIRPFVAKNSGKTMLVNVPKFVKIIEIEE